MPDFVIEMQPGTSTSQTFTTSGRGADGVHWTSTSTSQSGDQFDFPGFNSNIFQNDPTFGPTFARMFPTGPTSSSFPMGPPPSSTKDPPTYKEAVFGESDASDPLLSKPVPSAPRPQETQSNARRDVSSLIVRDSPAAQESGDIDKDTCFVLGVRAFIVVGIIAGILLVLWEYQYQASVGPNPDRMARKQFNLRQGFGWTFIVLALIMYFTDGYAMFKTLDEWNSTDLLGHLEKVKRGTPKLTWYMTTFNRDSSTVVITNADGSMRTDQRNDKITTWSGTQPLQFSRWADVTPDQMDILGAINTITFHSKFVLADEATKRAYEAQKQVFIDANRHKGQEYSIEEIFEIEGFEKKMVATGPSSILTNFCTLCLAFLTFGCYYFWVCCISANERKVSYTHIKELSV